MFILLIISHTKLLLLILAFYFTPVRINRPHIYSTKLKYYYLYSENSFFLFTVGKRKMFSIRIYLYQNNYIYYLQFLENDPGASGKLA